MLPRHTMRTLGAMGVRYHFVIVKLGETKKSANDNKLSNRFDLIMGIDSSALSKAIRV